MSKTYLFSISSHPDAVSVNSLQINLFKPQVDFSKYDYLIITSKQASKFLEQYETHQYKDIPALCVSVQSALSYENLGGQVLEVGGGYGDNLISKIKSYPKESRWLYLRAKVVASNFASLCVDDGYIIDELISYESSCSEAIKSVEVEEKATLIFTSPSSVKCFLKNHTIESSHKVIVIGRTTAKALPDDIEYKISQDTTIKSCMDETY